MESRLRRGSFRCLFRPHQLHNMGNVHFLDYGHTGDMGHALEKGSVLSRWAREGLRVELYDESRSRKKCLMGAEDEASVCRMARSRYGR